MSHPLPTVLVPALFCTPRLWEPQTRALWNIGPVTLADHRRDDTIAAIATRLIATAPPRFALAGISLGGYIALEVMRQAPDRVAKLALLSTSARPDTPEQTEKRQQQIELSRKGRFAEVAKLAFPQMLHPDHHGDAALRDAILGMAEQTGAEAFIRQQTAIMGRVDSRPHLARIACPTLVLAAADDAVIPGDVMKELAGGIPNATFKTVANAGHLSTLDQPEAVTQALVDFLSS